MDGTVKSEPLGFDRVLGPSKCRRWVSTVGRAKRRWSRVPRFRTAKAMNLPDVNEQLVTGGNAKGFAETGGFILIC